MLGGYAGMDFLDFFFMDGRPSIFWAVELGAVATVPVIAKPNAGMPVMDDKGMAHYSMEPGDFAAAMVRLVDAGASIVGGCCGTNPEYIRALRRAVKER